MDPLVLCYRRQVVRGHDAIGPIYSVQPLVQRGYGLAAY